MIEMLFVVVPVSVIVIILLFLSMAFEKSLEDRLRAIRSIYVYAVSFISLCVFLFGLGSLVYTGLSHSVFPKALNQDYSYRLAECDYLVSQPEGLMTGKIMPERNQTKESCLAERREMIAEEKEARFQSSMLSGIIMILIAFPVYAIHFFYLRKRED